jgi:hypothetical protein
MALPNVLVWAGGEHPFLLRIGELRAIDDACDGGAYAAWERLVSRRPRFDDVYEVVRLGLIGGGMDTKDAGKLVAKVEAQSGIGEMLSLATLILFRAFHRREDDAPPQGESDGEETPKE